MGNPKYDGFMLYGIDGTMTEFKLTSAGCIRPAIRFHNSAEVTLLHLTSPIGQDKLLIITSQEKN